SGSPSRWSSGGLAAGTTSNTTIRSAGSSPLRRQRPIGRTDNGRRCSPPLSATDMRSELKSRCDSIEECYEFMLAYAGQGALDDRNPSGGELRRLLRRCDEALAD